MLTGKDPMPFGKYKGFKMEDVPAYYLIYMYGKIKPIVVSKMYLSQKEFIKYFEENKDVIYKQNNEYYKGL